MSNYSTTARPYAKAAFQFAQDNNAFDVWSHSLQALAIAAEDDLAQSVFSNPKMSKAQRAEIFLEALGGKADAKVSNFVNLLATYDRLSALPEISAQFEVLKAEVESVVEGTLYSAKEVDAKQEKAIIDALSKRLNKTVKLHTEIDESLIGGVKIKVGDLVIDGSMRARLDKMASALTAA